MAERKLVFSVGIHDCKVDTFTVGGHGGAGKDTSNTGVRLTHEPSGAIGRATDTRSQLKNKQLALRRMAETEAFRAWARLESSRLAGMPSIDDQVEEAMRPENLKVEVQLNGMWIDAQ